MLSEQMLKCLRLTLPVLVKRDFGIHSANFAERVSPTGQMIQQLFLQKLRDYTKKSQALGGKMVDPSPELERELAAELDKIAKQYGGEAGADRTKFPQFQFKDAKVDPINLQQ